MVALDEMQFREQDLIIKRIKLILIQIDINTKLGTLTYHRVRQNVPEECPYDNPIIVYNRCEGKQESMDV